MYQCKHVVINVVRKDVISVWDELLMKMKVIMLLRTMVLKWMMRMGISD